MSNGIQYMPLPSFEKQVYQPHQIVYVMTNKRMVSLVEIRPVDQLFAILRSLASSTMTNFTVDEFEEFVVKFGIEETCNMLVQIVSST